MSRKLFTILGALLLFAAGFVAAQQSGKTLFDQAQAKKASGDLQGAAEGFERVITEFGTTDRNSTAKALLALGEIFESMGQSSRSRSNYERVRNDFKDQTAEAAIAAFRLNPSNRMAPTKVTIPTLYTDDVYSFAISPDGQTLVFQGTTPDGKRQLWRQAVDVAKKPEPIAGTEGAGVSSFPFFSPDGKSLGFFLKQKMYQVDLAGGTAKELTDAPSPWGASWNGESILMAVRGIGGPVELFEGGRTRPVVAVPGLYESPRFLDARRFIYYSRDQRGGGTLAVGSTDGSTASARGLPQVHAAAYSRGHLLFVPPSSSLLSAIPFDVKEMAASGVSSIVADKVGREDRYPGLAAFSVSAEGTVAYREEATLKRQMMWMDRTGALLGAIGTPDAASPGNPRLSPDGRVVLYFRQAGVPLGSVWVMDTLTGEQRMFQDGAVSAVWTGNADQISFSGLNPSFSPTIGTRPMNSAARGSVVVGGRPITQSGAIGVVFPEDQSLSGYILFRVGNGGAGAGGDLFALPPIQGQPSIPVAQSGATERNGRFSPDGNWIVYQSDETSRNEIYVQPFPGSMTQRQRVSLGGGTNPQWGRGGREMYFISPDNRLMAASAEAAVNGDKRSIELGTPKALFSSPLPQGSEYDVDNLRDRFLILAPVENSIPIVVLSNWMQAK